MLGSYISTYLYCLIVLNSIHKKITVLSLFQSFLSFWQLLQCIANIILLIIFIHQIATSIQADKVISDISAFISKQVRVLFPEKMGDEPNSVNKLPIDEIKSKYANIVLVKSPKSGYLQYIDSESMLNISKHSA